MTFDQLNLQEPLLKALKETGYSTPTPIQEQSIPVVLQQKDLLGCAQTGTGKTAAFAIPVLQLLHRQQPVSKGPRAIKALVLTPTRELAIQIEESFRAYGKYTGLTKMVIFGGVSQGNQVNALRNGVDILIATPGRLLDLINQGFISLQQLQIFVLDEADRMLDMGFIHDVKRIIARIPVNRQTLFFSATMPSEIAGLANTILKAPVKVEVTPVSSTAEKIEQQIYFADKDNKRSLLIHVLENPAIERALVFARTKYGSDKIARALNRAGIKADAIHGDKSQNARQHALTNFKNGKIRILVATDIAARGIDVDNLTHVINYELPNVPETYVHRIGRTGRAGASGIAISFCDAEERAYLKDIQKVTKQSIPVVEDHPYHSTQTVIKPQPAIQQKTAGGAGNRNNGHGNKFKKRWNNHSVNR
ncbi:DEAD/DEAH box helicase [Pseudoflavitalea sp. X16]|uniref:DEAD/DEAH box helicase n=1 Tax=Paraflavitalea devenefica TaxID=2716334 RepID=UPI00141DA738|nr:DEAD/DEAH box helicase [Paraflavitalea devenefica]NII27085.1 DEAD/DEAH box helicase [Paraflavitalea devenefica]